MNKEDKIALLVIILLNLFNIIDTYLTLKGIQYELNAFVLVVVQFSTGVFILTKILAMGSFTYLLWKYKEKELCPILAYPILLFMIATVISNFLVLL